MTDIGLYNKRQVIDLTTLSESTLWRRVKEGAFPAPVTVSHGRVAWPRKVIHDWLAAHGAADVREVAR